MINFINLIKTLNSMEKSQQKTPTLKNDFVQFFIDQTGETLVENCEFQNIQQNELGFEKSDEQQHDDFYIEQQQQTTDTHGIKTKQFWKGFVQPDEIEKPNQQKVQFVLSCKKSFGFNSLGRDNILLIDGEVCKAIGCMLIIGQKVYAQHKKQISTLTYDSKLKQLVSATEQPKPQIILWKYNQNSKALQFVKKLHLGNKSQMIYATEILPQKVLCIEKFTLNKSSILNVFEKASGKKVSVKIGKCYDIQSCDLAEQKNIYICNNQGMFQVKINDNNIELNSILKQDDLTAIYPFVKGDDIKFIIGTKKGSLSLVFSNFQKELHRGWVFQIKGFQRNQQNYIFSIGAKDFSLVLSKVEKQKLVTIRKFTCQGYIRSLNIDQNILLTGNRNGKVQMYSIQKLLKQQSYQKCLLNQEKSLSDQLAQKEFFLYSKDDETYYYANSSSKYLIKIFSKNLQIQSQSYQLRQKPDALCISNGKIIYSYDVYHEQGKKQQNIQIFGESMANLSINCKQSQKNIQKKIINSVIVVQDLSDNNLLPIKFSIKNQKKQFPKCVCLNIRRNTDLIAIGCQDGSLGFIDLSLFEQNQSQDLQIKINFVQHNHKQSIVQLIWSTDSNYLRSQSMSQVYFWRLQHKQGTLNIQSIKAKQAKNVKWQRMGRYSYQTKTIWQKTGTMQQIETFWSRQMIRTSNVSKKQIESQKRKIIGCNMQDGTLKLYKSPLNKYKFVQVKLFNQKFKVLSQSSLSSSQLDFWVYSNNMLVFFKIN